MVLLKAMRLLQPLWLTGLLLLLLTQAAAMDDCGCGATDRFCDPNREYPRCWDCEDAVRYRHEEAVAAAQFRGGTCSCQQDSDCLESEYCNLLPTDNPFCDRCDAKDPATNGFCESCYDCHAKYGTENSSFECPLHCYCQSSEECPENHYCAANDNPLFGPINSGVNYCVPCGDCFDGHLANSNEACPNLCPDQVQCVSHDECNNGTESLSRWCDKQYKCNDCSSLCFEALTSSYYQDPLGDFCPESCCGFGMEGSELRTLATTSNGEHYIQEGGVSFRMRPCNPLDIQGYVMKGLHPNVRAVEIAQKGESCRRTVQDHNSYVVVDCTLLQSSCSTGDYTLALVVTDGDGTKRYIDEDLYPYAHTFTNRYDSCALNDVYRTLSTGGIILAVVVPVLVLFCCCTGCYWYQRNKSSSS